MENMFEVYQKRNTLALYIIGCLIFIGIAFLYIKYAEVFSNACQMGEFSQCCFSNPLYYFVIGKGLLAYFSLCLLLFCYLLIRPYKLFYMNTEGFWSKEYGFINWDNISDLHMGNIALQTAICFNVKDKTALKIPFYNKISQTINKVLYGREFFIGFSGTYDMVYEIFKIMKSRSNA